MSVKIKNEKGEWVEIPSIKGSDGVSPVVEVTESENGHIVKITDAEGEHIFEVLNGKDGQDGTGGGEVSIDEIDAEKVFFSTDLITTKAIGNITLTNGQATINAKGKNLKQVWNTIFVKEQNPSRTNPSVTLTFNQAGEYELGTKIRPKFTAKFNAGSYTYGPATGVKVTSWKFTDTEGNELTLNSTETTLTDKVFPDFELQVVDSTEYTITARAYHTEGAVPVTNVGNPYPSYKIAAGSKSKTSGMITGYRKSFYGTVDNKNTVTASVIRGLDSSDTALADGDSFVVEVPVGALRVIIAYPLALRDITSIKDVNASRSEISSSFKLQKIDVPGANGYKPKSYKVYTMDFAEPYDTANTFEVTI